jgi:hypothetical protein
MASALRISPIPAVATALGAALIAFGPGDAPPVHSTVSPNVQLTSGDELIAMSGTGTQQIPDTPTDDQLGLVIQAINERYGTDFVDGQNVNDLPTPEGTYAGAFQDDEIDLLNALSNYQGDNVTVFGVSQSGAAVGLAINAIETGQFPTGESSVSQYAQTWGPIYGGANVVNPLPSNFSAADLPQNIHWLALAPDTMPLHANAGGQFSDDFSTLSHDLYGNVPLFPTDAGNADVYCGMYDTFCDVPSAGSSASYAYSNSEDGTTWVHGYYTQLTPQELDYEVNHATEFTINDPAGNITIYPDGDAPTDMTHFYLMPDVINWGDQNAALGAPGSDYDSLLPYLGSDLPIKNFSLGDQPVYEEWLPYDTLQVDAGYDDALHPFEYMIDNTWYTFYNDAVVPVADLPAGAAPPIVDSATLTADDTLAWDIAMGLVSPTGTTASTAATDLATEAATASTWWSDFLASI